MTVDIDTLARKLEPLMPDRVRRWQRLRDTADAEVKSLVEKQIVNAAYRALGDFRRKTLLSLPPERIIHGPYQLGTVMYDTPRWPAGLTSAELLQNVAIFGRSGAGKTNAAFNLLLQLAERRVPWIFLDWKRTARHLLPFLPKRAQVYTPGRSLSEFPFNPFLVPPGLEPGVYFNLIGDVLAAAFTLGDGAVSVVQHALRGWHARSPAAPTADDLIAEIERAPATGRARGWRATALRALSSVSFTGALPAAAASQEQLVDALLGGHTVVELDALADGGKRFLIPLLCLWLYYVRLAAPDRETLRLVLFIEEAHHVLYGQGRRSQESVMEMLLRQCREIGIAIVVVDQHPHLISSAALGNTFTTLCLNLKDPADVNRAAGVCLLEEGEKRCLGLLPTGQAVVKMQDRWRRPFLVRIPRVDVPKGSVTDQMIADWRQSGGTRSGVFAGSEGVLGRVLGVRTPDEEVLSDTALGFLEDVLGHADDGVRARYQRLGLSGQRGHALKSRLVRHGWLQAQLVPVGRSRKLLLRLSPAAHEALGTGQPGPRRESLAHEYWKRWYARLLREQGYEVHLEARRHGGAVDVLGVKDGRRVAVEVETGHSTVAANVRNCIESGFQEILVVATTPAALTTVRHVLEGASLTSHPPVTIVRAGLAPRATADDDGW